MRKKPLLSICIPTYNRCHILEKVIRAYIQSTEFDDDVEIIISDNCSSDETQEICRYYSGLHENILYYRNDENIKDKNFIKVLDYAQGEYLKLVNDWVYYDNDSLMFLKETIKENMVIKKPIFFTNDVLFTKKKAEIVKCKNLDDYVSVVSTFVTSNNVFGVWRDHWQKVENKSRYSALMLQQVDWTFQIVSRFNGCIIFDRKTLKSTPTKMGARGGYNWFQIHLDNYYRIMQPYIENGAISSQTFINDKHYLLDHFRPELCYTYFFNYTSFWRFETSGTTPLLWKYYKKDPYIILVLFKLPIFYLNMLVHSIWRHLFKEKSLGCHI